MIDLHTESAAWLASIGGERGPKAGEYWPRRAKCDRCGKSIERYRVRLLCDQCDREIAADNLGKQP